jgi:chromosome segregation ATPase
MTPEIVSLRLRQLEANVGKISQLLNEYEEELIDEDDPARKSKYHRRIEKLKQQQAGYEAEFSELHLQANEYSLQAQTVSSQLREISSKIEFLLDSQASLSQLLMQYFSPVEQSLILPCTERLDESELMQMQFFLKAVDTGQASEEEIQIMLTEARKIFKEWQDRNLTLPAGNEALSEIINSPTIDTRHALKVSIPIIPFILSYEGDLGLGSGVDLKKLWQQWKTKFYKN